MKSFRFLMLGIIALAAASCSAPKDIVYFQDLTPEAPKLIPEVEFAKIKPEDKLLINVHCRDENISKLFNVLGHGSYGGGYRTGGTNSISLDMHTYNVDADGNIDFPVVGIIHVGGLSRQEIADHIRDVLVEQNLVKDPYVSCSLASSYFYTMGEIGGKQIMMPKDAVTIIEAIAQAGDLNMQGVRTNVQVLREVNGKLHTYSVDLTSAESLLGSPAYYIQPNDIIYVQPNKKRLYSTTALGNSVRTPSFWMGTLSTVLSLGLTIYAVTQKFK